jgi:hypothetical protein
MSLSHLIYISRSCVPLSCIDAELALISAASERNNGLVDVSGLLLFNAGHFLQLLEGDDLTLMRLYDRIATDVRHDSVQRLIFQETDQRMFSRWAMGVMNLDGAARLDQQRFSAIAAACREASPTEQLARLYGEFRTLLPAAVGVN